MSLRQAVSRRYAPKTANGDSITLKVLLLSYYYPPDRAVGGQRARKVAEALRAAGHDVTVIAAGVSLAESEGLVRIKPILSVRELWARLRSRKRETGNIEGLAAKLATAATEGTPRTVPRWKRWIFSLIWLPDDRQGYILPVVWHAMRHAPSRPDLIYTSAPPFSVHLAGLLLKGLTGARWVAEFRDPWTTNPWKQGFLRSALSDWTEIHLERLCLGQADLVVAASEGIADRIRDRDSEAAIVIVRNGIERVEQGAVQTGVTGSDLFQIVYAGTFYHSRSPFPFIEAIEQLVRHDSEGSRILVRLIGTPETFDGTSIADFVRDRGLTDVVLLEEWMDHRRCLESFRSADALFLLATQQPDQVPNKLYEYLGTRRPILAVTDAHGETARMLRQVGGHFIVPQNEKAPISTALKELIRSPSSAVGDPDLLIEWSTERQMTGLAAAVRSLMSR